MVACVCVYNPNILFITMAACCGITGVCCCFRGNSRIPHFRRYSNVHPTITSSQSEIIKETQKVVLITNPTQSEIFIGFPYTNGRLDVK